MLAHVVVDHHDEVLHFLRYALSSLETVTTAELSSIITAGSNSGMLSSEHMYIINSMSLTRVYSQHGWKRLIPESVWHFGCRRYHWDVDP